MSCLATHAPELLSVFKSCHVILRIVEAQDRTFRQDSLCGWYCDIGTYNAMGNPKQGPHSKGLADDIAEIIRTFEYTFTRRQVL